MNTRRKKKKFINFIRLIFIWITKEFFNLIKFLCNFIFFDVMFFINVSQTLRRFFVWYAFHMFLQIFQKKLDENFVWKNDLFSFVCKQLNMHYLRSFNLSRNRRFFVFRWRRFRASNKQCLICWQKFLINTSCLYFFMRCLKNICKRVICNWINCTCAFVSRICIEILLKLSLIKRKFCCYNLINLFVVTMMLFERSCDAC